MRRYAPLALLLLLAGFAAAQEPAQLTTKPAPGKYLGYAAHTEPARWIVFAEGFNPISPTVIEGGKAVLFEGAGKIAVVCLPPGDAQPIVQTVQLGPVTPPTPPVPPVPPTPPDPDPPDPPTPPTPDLTGLAKEVWIWGSKLPPEARQQCNQMGALFGTIGRRYESTNLVTVSEAFESLRRGTADLLPVSARVAWKTGFSDPLQARLDTAWEAGEFKNRADVLKWFRDIEKGLRAVK